MVAEKLCFAAVADLVFKNATIFTGDSSMEWAEAMALSKGRILRIGSFHTVQGITGPNTEYHDLEGRFVVPGFIDSHVHFILGGLQMEQINLQDAWNPSDFIKTVQSGVQEVKSGQWVLGGGWNDDRWGGELPSASWIDSFTQDNPVWIYRMDGHMALANSKALQLAGITEDVADPEGGSFIRGNDGGLTGIVVDSAMKLVVEYIPQATAQERRDALARASKEALSKGITAVVDFGRFLPGFPTRYVWDDFHDVYKWADQMGNLLLRVTVFFPLGTWSDVHKQIEQSGPKLSQNLKVGGVKAFADGSLGSGSALFNEPYADDPGNFGLELINPGTLMKDLLEADRRGLQIATHAIGDAANDRMLALYQELKSKNGHRDRRLRIEHAQHLQQTALEMFWSQHIVASMQPEHLLNDAYIASRKLGDERALKQSYLFKSLLTRTTVAFGSDWPVMHLNPLRGMQAATERKAPGWNTSWMPSECIDVKAALEGYTSSSAYASFMDDDIGSLSPGKFADFAVLSGNIFENLDQITVLETYKGGIKLFSMD